jgi:hypothetical protein
MSPKPGIQPASPSAPPLGVPGSIALPAVSIGRFASGTGGGLPKLKGNVFVRIDGDSSGVFSVLSLETEALVHDPELPGSARSWETVLLVNGSGPIPIESTQALLVTVGCRSSKPGTFAATAAVANTASGPALFHIPIQATVVAPNAHPDLASILVAPVGSSQFAPSIPILPGSGLSWLFQIAFTGPVGQSEPVILTSSDPVHVPLSTIPGAAGRRAFTVPQGQSIAIGEAAPVNADITLQSDAIITAFFIRADGGLTSRTARIDLAGIH